MPNCTVVDRPATASDAVPARSRRWLHDSGFRTVRRSALPAGSEVAVVAGAGHFLQLERPEDVGRRIVEFLSR